MNCCPKCSQLEIDYSVRPEVRLHIVVGPLDDKGRQLMLTYCRACKYLTIWRNKLGIFRHVLKHVKVGDPTLSRVFMDLCSQSWDENTPRIGQGFKRVSLIGMVSALEADGAELPLSNCKQWREVFLYNPLVVGGSKTPVFERFWMSNAECLAEKSWDNAIK